MFEITYASADMTLAYYAPQDADMHPVLVVVQEPLDSTDEVLVEGVLSGGMWRARTEDLRLVPHPDNRLVLDYDIQRWRK